jgi:hypothetical protein
MTVARREHGNRVLDKLGHSGVRMLHINRRDHQTVQNLSFSGALLLYQLAAAAGVLLQHTGPQAYSVDYFRSESKVQQHWRRALFGAAAAVPKKAPYANTPWRIRQTQLKLNEH